MLKEITTEVVNTFLNGHDPMERIISIECAWDEDKVNIIYVNEKGEKRIKQDDFKPFIWVKHSAAIRLFNGNRAELRKQLRTYGISIKKLITSNDKGEEHERLESGYKYLFYATRRMSNQIFQSFFTKAGVPIHPKQKKGETNTNSNREFMGVTPVEQYMIATGRRLFKGYDTYDELNRFIFDLETQGLNPKRHRIEQIGIHSNKGYDKVISVEGKTKEELDKNEIAAIEEFLEILAELKPDTVVGHNSENFDWNFFIVRCEMLGVDFSELSLKYFKHAIYKKKKEAVLKLGGEVEYYFPTIMWGHNVLDSLHAARRAQAIDSNMKSSNLKYLTKYLNMKKPNRIYVPGDKISSTWNVQDKVYGLCEKDGDWYRVTNKRPLLDGYNLVSGRYIVERYLLDDLWETDKVEDKLNESNFLVGKMLPTNFARACTMGTAGIWKLIMLAWCYENDLAIPAAAPNKRFTGGLSRLLKTGYVDRIVKLDYNSLYPSVILTWHVSTPIDVMNVMLSFLEYILTQREKYKGLKADAGDKVDSLKDKLKTAEGNEKGEIEEQITFWKAEKSGNDKKQLPLKILANSFFGGYGSPNVFPFGDILAAEKTTCISRMALRLMISHFKSIGYEPIVGDSVTYDTPILIKGKDNRIDIIPICDIFNANEAVEFEQGQYRDFSKKDYEVLTRNGWKPIEYVYKHKTNKQLKRVETKNGVIDCTEDHSLFDNNGNEVKPSTLARGDKIEIYTKDINYFASSTVTDREAWLFGFFMADGSSVYCDRTQKYYSKRKGEWVTHKGKRASWKISNKSLNRLNKAKEIMENSFLLKASIKDHRTSSNVYNLVVENAENAKFFSNNFYTSYRYKKVPEFILNAKKEVKKAFLDGFCCGDGQNDTIDECIEFGQKSKVAMAGLYFLMKELDYNFRCHNRNDKQEFISFRLRNHRGSLLNENYSKRKEDEVWSCSNITSKSEYVYDISADGTFVNALGMIVCHNTDGFNFQMPKEEDFRYTKEHPYISNGAGRNSIKGKEYTRVDADVAEFEDIYLSQAYNGGINKMGLGIDEYCDACIQFARKNYADLMPDGKTKKVGNTIKSRKMSGYLEKFIDEGVDLLLRNNGYKFLSNYYDYINKIYNYQIPIKDIASKGNIKKTLKEYEEDCKTLTKAGSKKSRQAWYELALKENLNVSVGDTVFYINTGTKKGHSDVKRITHYFYYLDGEKTEITKEVEKLYKDNTKYVKENGGEKKTRIELAKEKYGKSAFDEDEIILNCKLVPNEILDKEEDVLCSEYEGLEYNVEKYIEQFNKRITPLLVCFHPDIRNKILITNPKDKQYFTEEESKLVSGYPNKEGDQDTYEALMTPERKEIEFWLKINEVPPFVKECGIDWDNLVEKHKKEVEEENDAIFQEENKKYLEALEKITNSEVDEFETEGEIPQSLNSIVTLNSSDMRFYFKKIPNKTPSTGGFIFDDIQHNYSETVDALADF